MLTQSTGHPSRFRRGIGHHDLEPDRVHRRCFTTIYIYSIIDNGYLEQNLYRQIHVKQAFPECHFVLPLSALELLSTDMNTLQKQSLPQIKLCIKAHPSFSPRSLAIVVLPPRMYAECIAFPSSTKLQYPTYLCYQSPTRKS